MSDSGNQLPDGDGWRLPGSRPAGPRRDASLQRALPIYYALLFAILTVAALYLLVQLRDVLVLLFISVLFAAAVARPAAQLERLHIPRGVAAVLVYLFALGLLVGIGWLVLPPLFRQIAGLGADLPGYLERYQELRDEYEELRQRYPGLEPFEARVGEIGGSIIAAATARLVGLPTTLFELFLDVLSVFVISLLLVTNRERLLAFILSMVHPARRERTRRVLEQMGQRLGHYLRAKLIVMAIIGAITYVALLLIGVPYPLLLALVVAVGEAIPRVGPWLARIPLLTVAALNGWLTLGLTFGASVVIENAKGYVISPFVEGEQLDIHPLLVFVAVLVGAALLGPAGGFIAVPAAALIQVLFEEVIIPWRLAQFGGDDAVREGEPVKQDPALPRG